MPTGHRPASSPVEFRRLASAPAPVPAVHPVRVTVLVPAHDEEASLPATLESLRGQTLPPHRVLVVADGCTDRTEDVARAGGADVVVTADNAHRKAGALNQVLGRLLPALAADELVLVMDADSVVVPRFLEIAAAHLAAHPRTGAVGGVFYGETGGGLVGALQRNEYCRYAREIARRRGRTSVLTGTASLFRAGVLREVAAARGGVLPGRRGQVYDTLALTEDNEITLAIRTLGRDAVSPRACGVLTEIMPTWGDLWRQRLRWQRGALENLRHYGVTRITLPYLLKQVGMYLGIVAVLTFLAATALFAALGLLGAPEGFWLAVTALFVVERVWTVRRRGWRGIALAAPIVVEFAYDLFQQAVYLRAASDALLHRTAQWHHLTPGRN
jgi:poly-beta-1,6-N-acetyl-D-glucosamine synthase